MGFSNYLIAFCAASLPVASSEAGVILSPISASSSGGTLIGSPAFTVDQSGLSDGFSSGVDDFDTFNAGLGPASVTHTSANSAHTWIGSSSVFPQWMTYDLGSEYTVERVAFWQGYQSADQSITSLTFFADDEANPLDDLGSNLGGFSPSTASASGQVFDLTNSNTRYIHLQINSISGPSVPALGEIAFDVVAVPEVSSVLVLTGVLGGFLIGSRRRPGSAQR